MPEALKPVLRRQMEVYAGFLEYTDHHVGRLLDSLKHFDGTMLFVSHDREFLRGLSNRVLELGGESGVDAEPHVYPGSYIEYVARTGHEAPGVHH